MKRTFLNSFRTKLPIIAYCSSAKQFQHYSNFLIKMVSIVDFGAFLGCRLKSTMALKELTHFLYFGFFSVYSRLIIQFVCIEPIQFTMKGFSPYFTIQLLTSLDSLEYPVVDNTSISIMLQEIVESSLHPPTCYRCVHCLLQC